MIFKKSKKQISSVLGLAEKERKRQENSLNLIASENIPFKNVLKASGSILMSKYSGNKYIDQIESLAIEKGKKLFNADHINVQPHSGSSANMASYFALTDWLGKGKKILAMA